MKIIIPMSGEGKRFLETVYKEPKPLIEVDGKPIIEHVVNMFSKDDEFIFICSKEHLKNTKLRSVLDRIAPKTKIIGIDAHKLGPVYATTFAFDHVSDDEPVIVCYCDFCEWWNYKDFKKTVESTACDAAVTAYKGFHPHLLGSGLYASMRVDANTWMLECREKHSFTKNKMDSFQQSGKFYFSRGRIFKKYFMDIINRNLMVNGEYYVSTVTQALVENGLTVYVYPVHYFLQWGTPKDLEEYIHWSNLFRNNYTYENSWDETTKKVFNYWRSFFAICPWHSYGATGIKGILLDLDNTLYDYEICNTYAKSELFKKIRSDTGINIEELEKVYESARDSVKSLLGNTGSSHSRLLYIQKTLETLNIKNYMSRTAYYDDFFWQKFFEKMQLFEGVEDFLRYAIKNKIKVCIVSDMTAKIQMNKIYHLGIEDYIHFLVSSEEAGHDKPHSSIFVLALEKMGLQKEHVIVIGDDEKKDITGAESLGIRAIKSDPYIFRNQKIIEMINSL